MNILQCKNIKEKEITKLKENIKKRPKMAVIQIGDFDENNIYLRNKKKLASELKVELIEIKYHESNTKEEIINKILEFNSDKSIIGIMIQKPITTDFNYQELVDYIDYKKDIDGVGSINQERLKKGIDCIIPCTARAVLKVFEEYRIELKNKTISIIGKSNLVGLPLYHILKEENNTILCDSKTENLKIKIQQSDIIISAIGKANYFDSSYFKEGQVIIDVGTNYLDGKLVGDIDFKSIDKQVYITPVPGGIGMLTPVYLFWNLLEADRFQNKNK